ncbi:MAG TPA: hypothetical protein VKB75_15630 [Jatrophihabitans sp.]|nr:hypothetical protein [Jatrophihabitans sp.]
MPTRKPRGPGRPTERGTAAARRKAAAFREAEAARLRRRRIARWAGAIAVVAVVAAVIAIAAVTSHHGKGASSSDVATATLTGPPGPEGIVLEEGPLLAPVSTAAKGQPVGGIQCNAGEQVAYHIHTHVAVFVNGALRAVPPGVGVVEPVPQQTANGVFVQASRCYYWLHTHAQDGVIHVEAPSQATYTLGQFFAIWRQPLDSTRVGPVRGAVTTFVDGRKYTGNPAAIVLRSREDVQLDIGTPAVAPRKVDWSHSQL